MNSFVDKFRDEVNDYLERLESGLLILEQEPANVQVIGEIFRLMHSMKGSGGMFGFNLLSDVTHDLESLFDLFRTEKCLIDPEVISFTLSALDGFSHLMVLEPKKEDLNFAEMLKAETKLQISRLTNTLATGEVVQLAEPQSKIILNTKEITYFISFVPNEDILSNGTNPLYLLDELNALGECNVQASFDRLPPLEEIDPTKCYVSWYLFIATEESVETLNDVFIFVFDSAQINIEKVCSGNIIHDEAVMAGFLNVRNSNGTWNPEKPDRLTSESERKLASDTENPNDNVAEIRDKEIRGNALFSPATVDSIKVDARKIDQYMNLISELITAQSHLDEITSKLKNPELELVAENFGKLGRQLKENAFDMSLIPLQSISGRFNRLVHDLSRSLDKEVVLITEGMETELDKNIIEKLLEPLLHIIRNSMDHGIESKTERQKKNKELIGKILIKASTVGSHVQIEIEDDGAGLDVEQIKKKALAIGLYSELDSIQETDIYNLIFEPGFSTSKLITDVSGRGVGMDVVRRRVQEMRGTVEVITEKDQFTRFTLKLPLSLSIIDGLLTTVGSGFFVIPSAAVRKIYSINPQYLTDEKGCIELDDMQIAVLNLHDEFEPQSAVPEEQFVVAVARENQWFGLIVDDVLREYQAVVKPLNKSLTKVEIFSGASILGTGHLALVIDTNKMIEKYF